MNIRIALFAGASLLALQAGAVAQDGATTELSEIVVSGEGGAAAETKGYVAKSAAAGTKTDTPVLETQRSVSVVTRDEMDDRGAQTLGQALSTTAGVLGEPFGADPRFDSPSLRGFDMRNAQYLNGLRLMRSSGAPSYDIYGLERVEVLKGPASSLYGSGTPAGVINMVQKHAQFRDAYEAGTGFTLDGDKEVFLDANKAWSDTLAARFTGKLSDTEEDIDELTNKRGYLGLATRWSPSDATTVDFLASYQKDSPITPAGIPFALTGKGNDDRLRDLYIGDPSVDESDRRMSNIGYELHHEFDNGWAIDQSARYQKFDWDYAGFYVSSLTAPSTVNRGVIFQDEDTWTANLDTRFSGEVETGAIDHKLLFGIDLRKYGDNTTSQFATSSALDINSPTPAIVGAPWYTSTNDLKLGQVGIYAQDELSFDQWRATVGLRHDWTDQHGTSGATIIDQQDSATTGNVGLSYLFDSGFAPYVSYATSFDPVIGADIAGDVLKPTTGEQWEVGLKYEPTSFDGLFSVAFYDLTQDNVSVSVTEGGVTGTRQIGQVKSRGIEIEGAAEIAMGWSVKGAYSYTDAEQVGSNDGKMPANIPHHLASLWLSYEFAEDTALTGLSIGGGLRYVGERFNDNANTASLDPVTLVDLAAKYAVTDKATLAVNLNNLTDETYVANCGSFGCYYGAGRSVMGTLTVRW
ncbi:TonB-dependent siderophore receptor [Rhizobium rhizophilum]|uniref:TonB-dependent siderophore receptor n=1 Tax=Rhizobium rhizophilum TaxID=1850373 RepID=A0ABY2QTE9_9HYPH|nr:TonB-dependent siderophore receptor [Rhizobium rhizophilum]THV12502.1 TonB-dependent siderophore receptor [Rhizobium rhizophilum]